MNRNVLSSISHLNRDTFKACIRRTISGVLMVALAGGSGSPVFAGSLVEPLAVLNEQLTRLSQFVPVITSKTYAAAQEILDDRGMPPNPPASAAIRPEPRKRDQYARLESPVSC